MGKFKFDLFFGFMILLLVGCSAGTPDIGMPNAVSELTAVEIGGIEQWVLIRGEDRSNPVLLWLHGGPGSAHTPFLGDPDRFKREVIQIKNLVLQGKEGI